MPFNNLSSLLSLQWKYFYLLNNRKHNTAIDFTSNTSISNRPDDLLICPDDLIICADGLINCPDKLLNRPDGLINRSTMSARGLRSLQFKVRSVFCQGRPSQQLQRFYYFRQGGYVFVVVWLFICLSVCQQLLAKRLPNGFAWNLQWRLVMGHWTND